VRAYARLEDALEYVASHDRPLALYPFSNDRATVERIVDANLAGGVAVNDTLVQFAVDTLPFGGIGPSGMGAIHGRAGFDTFSKLLPVFRQSRLAATDLLRPPYKGFVDRLVRFLAR
jgi:coniferyl-aldehyde dehydrogenase